MKKFLIYDVNNILFIALYVLITFFIITHVNIIKNIFFPNLDNNEDGEDMSFIKTFMWYIGTLCYLILFIILIYLTIIKTDISVKTKCLIILFYCLLIYIPSTPIINLINIILTLFYDNPPFIDDLTTHFPHYVYLENNYDSIKNEFIKYNQNNYINCLRDNNPLTNNIDTYSKDNCWRTLYLKRAGNFVNSLEEHFPITYELLKHPQIHSAIFSILDPKVDIKKHRGYYKGYLRYHLGIIIPETDNIDAPFIVCGGQKYYWKNGKSVMFDDMYEHYVKNPTNSQRVVLYLDIKRQNNNSIISKITDLGDFLIENSIILDYFIKNQHQQKKIII